MNKTTAATKGNDVILTRIFDAPHELVFKIWTQKEHLEKWWGPKFLKGNIIEIDLRVGGAYRFTMLGPTGEKYPMHGIFTEVVPNKSISYTVNLNEHAQEWIDMMRNNFTGGKNNFSLDCTTTVTFEDINGKTKVDIITKFTSEAMANLFVKQGMVQGWGESLEKLEELFLVKEKS